MTDTLDLRRALVANGYSPLPNVGKACYMSGWPSIEPTEENLQKWSKRHKRFADTGLRVENGLAVIDLDINHEVIGDVASAIEEKFPQVLQGLVRYGKGAKEAWFVRSDEPFTRLHTRRWLAPGHDLERDGAQVVEIFGGASPRQFGSFGAHTRGDDGDVVVAYEWAGDESPATVRLSDLPELTKTDFVAIVDMTEQILEAAGFTPVLRSAKGESEAHRVFDIPDDARFECNDMVERSLDELEAVAGMEGLRCSASWLEPGAGHSLTRCIIGRTNSGLMTIWDAATGVSHMRADKAPTDQTRPAAMTEMGLALIQKLKEAAASEKKVKRLTKLVEADDLQQAANKLLGAYALCPSQQLPVVPIYAEDVAEAMSLANFRLMVAPHSEPAIGANGQELKTRISPADIWVNDKTRRLTVAGLRMRPDRERPTYKEDGKLWINVYAHPVHDAEPEGRDVWDDFMEHLLPDMAEREWFLDWLAHKWQNPAVPGPGVIMVSQRQGAGRGTLFAMVRQLLGAKYVRKVDPVTLTGEGGQSQYNTWLANSTMVLIDELFNAGTGTHLWQRKKAYDRIKALIDPSSRDVEIIQKTLNNYNTTSYTTLLMATNNLNALPLDQDDRRVSVLTNGSVMLYENVELAARIAALRENGNGAFSAGFIAAISEALYARDLSGFSVFDPPPMFEGKQNMIFRNATTVGEAADEAILEMPGDYVTRKAFMERVRMKLAAGGEDLPKHWMDEARERLDRSAWVFMGRVKINEREGKADVWARNPDAVKRWSGVSWSEREGSLAINSDAQKKATDAQMRAIHAGLSVIRGQRPS